MLDTERSCFFILLLIWWSFAAINLVAFVLCGIDKFCAARGKKRIRERTLLLISICFGAAGFFIGMVIFHHKTRDKAFIPLVPLLLFGEICCIALCYQHFFRVF